MKSANIQQPRRSCLCSKVSSSHTRRVIPRIRQISAKVLQLEKSPAFATMKKVQLGSSDLQVSIGCIGTMVRPPLGAFELITGSGESSNLTKRS